MLEVGCWTWEEVAMVAGSVHINSPVIFLFLLLFFFLIFHVSYFRFRKYIRHQQCEFHQEDV
jgi:hypothetical protein